jgi:DNA-damage-inducible protein J
MSSETRLSVRVDPEIKKRAEDVFVSLGMNMTTGINVFLTQVAQTRAIPFDLRVRVPIEAQMHDAVMRSIADSRNNGVPIALYDKESNRPYLEYADGRRVYEID